MDKQWCSICHIFPNLFFTWSLSTGLQFASFVQDRSLWSYKILLSLFLNFFLNHCPYCSSLEKERGHWGVWIQKKKANKAYLLRSGDCSTGVSHSRCSVVARKTYKTGTKYIPPFNGNQTIEWLFQFHYLFFGKYILGSNCWREYL